MAGGANKYRHLNRTSAHRQALLRNLVTSLITHETIRTTWHKAKEAQRLAEKLITLGKRNSNASRTRAQQILFTPFQHMNKLFGELRARYQERPGGYTRVLRIEPINRHHDQAPSAVLELVDGPRDMRFAMTAKSLVRERLVAAGDDAGKGIRDITARNVVKVTRFRPQGEMELMREVRRLEKGEMRRNAALEEEEKERALKGKDKDGEVEDDEDVDFDVKLRRRPVREGWERWDQFQRDERKRRKVGYTIREVKERDAERARLRA